MVIILYTIMCLIFGTTFLFIKSGMSLGWSPFLFSSLRFILAGGFLLIFSWKKKGVSLEKHIKIGLISILMTTFPFGALYYGEQYINSGEAAIIVTISPIFILLFQYFFKKERVLIRQLVGALVCITGVLVLVLKDFSLTTQEHAVLAKVLILIGEIAFALGTIMSKAVLEKMEDSSKFNSLIMFYGGLGLGVVSLLKGESYSIPTGYMGYLILVYFVVIASIVANGIFFVLVKRTNAFFPATWTYVSPLIAMALGSIVMKEHFGIRGTTGAILVLLGVVMANSQFIEKLKTTFEVARSKSG